MDEHLRRIEDKIDRVADDITQIKVTLAGQAVVQKTQQKSIDHHIKRTDTLEKLVIMVVGAAKFIGFLAVLGGLIEGIVSLLTYLKG